MKSKHPKWPAPADVDVMKCVITKRRKGQENSSRVIAESPMKAVHQLSTSGENGESQHWLRLFLLDGRPYVHSGYHTRNAKGKVQYGQFGSMLPKEEFEALIVKAIESGILTLPPRFGANSTEQTVADRRSDPHLQAGQASSLPMGFAGA